MWEQGGREAMSLYGEREDAVRPALQIAMPRLPRLYAPEGTMHVVARCNNRVFPVRLRERFVADKYDRLST